MCITKIFNGCLQLTDQKVKFINIGLWVFAIIVGGLFYLVSGKFALTVRTHDTVILVYLLPMESMACNKLLWPTTYSQRLVSSRFYVQVTYSANLCVMFAIAVKGFANRRRVIVSDGCPRNINIENSPWGSSFRAPRKLYRVRRHFAEIHINKIEVNYFAT